MERRGRETKSRDNVRWRRGEGGRDLKRKGRGRIERAWRKRKHHHGPNQKRSREAPAAYLSDLKQFEAGKKWSGPSCAVFLCFPTIYPPKRKSS
jgi:hypothetical protein